MTAKFKFGKRSLVNLVGIHPDMRAMTDLALELSEVDFAVTCGLRTPEQQAEALRTGASRWRVFPAPSAALSVGLSPSFRTSPRACRD